MKYSSYYTNPCYLLFFLHNFKIKNEVVIELRITAGAWVKQTFGHFQKGILQSKVAEFSL